VAEAYAFPPLQRGMRTGPGTATERAAQIVARAEAEAAAIRAEAERLGREEGFAAGLAEARERLVPGEAALAAAAAEVRAAQERLAAALEEQAVALALALADKVLSAALEVRPELVIEVVKGALRRVVERGRLTVQVNPGDLEVVSASLDRIEGSFGAVEQLELAGERRVPRGGCVVRTPEGELDATLPEQLERAAEVLRAALRDDAA
jgi:flagellar assembly protein FliH